MQLEFSPRVPWEIRSFPWRWPTRLVDHRWLADLVELLTPTLLKEPMDGQGDDDP